MNAMTIKDIVDQLNQNIENVLNYLLPNGKKQGNEYCVGSVGGEQGHSLKVHITGHKKSSNHHC